MSWILHNILLFVFFSPTPNPSYLISAPRVLRHGIPTSLSVTILRDSPVRIVSEIFNANISISKIESVISGGKDFFDHLP